MCAEALVRLDGLSKRFGKSTALDGVSLTIEAGEVFGYLGPNGAGKTTTIRLIMGMLRPTSGTATVLGLDSWRQPVQVHRLVGYVPGEPASTNGLPGTSTSPTAPTCENATTRRTRPGLRTGSAWTWTGRPAPSPGATGRSSPSSSP